MLRGAVVAAMRTRLGMPVAHGGPQRLTCMLPEARRVQTWIPSCAARSAPSCPRSRGERCAGAGCRGPAHAGHYRITLPLTTRRVLPGSSTCPS